MRILLSSLLLGLLASFTQAQTADELSRIQSLYQQGKYPEAIVLTEQVLARQPQNKDMNYAVACLFSLNHQPDSALVWLKRAVDAGLTDYLWFNFDTDLDHIRSLPGFASVVDGARKAALAENQAKAISLVFGQWNSFDLNSDSSLPRVAMSASYDWQSLQIKATVHDSHFKDGDRSWRYGDGFIVNFFAPASLDSVYSDRFHAFGFSMEKGQPTAVLINKDGTYYLDRDERLIPKILVDTIRHRADYTITIPWSAVYPFHPLLDSVGGINIIYTSQNEDGSRKTLTYIPNAMYDTEQSKLRRFAPVNFVPAHDSPLCLTGRLANRLIFSDSARATMAVWSAGGTQARLRVVVSDSSGQQLLVRNQDQRTEMGKHTITFYVPVPQPAGRYTVTVTLNDSVSWRESVYRRELANGVRVTKYTASQLANPLFSNSLDAREYREREMGRKVVAFGDRDDLDELIAAYADAEFVHKSFEKSGSVYTRPGYLLSAFRSPTDSTLQPFSIALPDSFDPSKCYDLLVALHGSGVDEVGTTYEARRSPNWKNMIIVAPRGRDLSGWYLGQDEQDVTDLIRIVKEMFRIRRTICYGFSMGGYGVWRMTLLHPELFDGAVCISGSPICWRDHFPQTDMRSHIGAGKNIRYLVIHGTEDRAVNITETDSLVSRLKDAGYQISYTRVPGGGHGDFNTREIVGPWLDTNFPGMAAATKRE